MKILLDMGHTLSGADTGAVGCGRKEQDCTREIGYKVKAKLEALWHTVVVCSKDSCSNLTDSLSYRAITANNTGGDIYVSIHLNAYNGNAYGTEIYTYGGKELTEARNVLNNLVALGYYNRGIKDGSKLYVIRNTKMKSMLIECGFIDNENDMSKYNPDKIADAIVSGLVGTTVESKPVEHKPVVTSNREYAEHGNATILVDSLNVRTEPSINALVVASYSYGETIYNYNRVYEADGYRWIRYTGGSGKYRYVAVRKLSNNKRYANCY